MSKSNRKMTLPLWGIIFFVVLALGAVYAASSQTASINRIAEDEGYNETIGDSMSKEETMKPEGEDEAKIIDSSEIYSTVKTTGATTISNSVASTYALSVSKGSAATMTITNALAMPIDRSQLTTVTIMGGITDGLGVTNSSLAAAMSGQLRMTVSLVDSNGRLISSNTSNIAVWSNTKNPNEAIVVQFPPTTKNSTIQNVATVKVAFSKPSAPVKVNVSSIKLSTNTLPYISSL